LLLAALFFQGLSLEDPGSLFALLLLPIFLILFLFLNLCTHFRQVLSLFYHLILELLLLVSLLISLEPLHGSLLLLHPRSTRRLLLLLFLDLLLAAIQQVALVLNAILFDPLLVCHAFDHLLIEDLLDLLLAPL
jgi:hypothetical protein